MFYGILYGEIAWLGFYDLIVDLTICKYFLVVLSLHVILLHSWSLILRAAFMGESLEGLSGMSL